MTGRFNKFICFFLAGLLILIIGRAIYLHTIPMQTVTLPSLESEDKIIIPPRPGVKGLIITGPQIEPLYFAIDLTKSGIQSLDWRTLQRTDPWTDVKVSGYIDEKGQLHFNQEDIRMGGHPEAGLMIQNALRTWRFTPYKKGMIRFWINMPSMGKKMMIDISQLKKVNTIPPYVPVYDGQLHFITGISNSDILLSSNF